MPQADFSSEHALTEAGSLFQRKKIPGGDDDPQGVELHRTLGPLNLIALGIGAIIGAGLFSLTGLAAGDNAGPAVVISFVIAAIGCGFAGMCYSELASMIPCRRQRLHLRLCDARRAYRLDYRLGPRSRICRGCRHRLGELVQICSLLPARFRHQPAGAVDALAVRDRQARRWHHRARHRQSACRIHSCA